MARSTDAGSGTRVALIMATVGDLSGSGGAERQFADLHDRLRQEGGRAVTTLITSKESLANIRKIGRLQDARGVLALSLGQHPISGIWRTAWLTLRLLLTVLRGRYDVAHVCLPTPTYVPLCAALGWLPRSWRPCLTLSVIDCTLAPSIETIPPEGSYERQVLEAHRLYFRWTRLDGMYSWYESVVNVLARRRLASNVMVRAARYCFADVEGFSPAEKAPVVVFAGRLSEQKRPLLFVEAVARLVACAPNLTAGVRFEMYGKGPLEPQVRAAIDRNGLTGLIALDHAPQMAHIFARSKLFVSTQAIENFTSLSMLEAMAAGNAIVAANVGQTAEFVHHGENGFLVREETPDAFAAAIADFLANPDRHDRMAAASRRIATQVHTIDHFIDDITSFWHAVLARPYVTTR